MLYDYPAYYEKAFSFRDIESEAAFIDQCINRFTDQPVRRVFEIGCGPAPHAKALSGFGYSYLGLDINLNMLKYARNRWSSLKPRPEFIRADMRAFELDQHVDFVFVTLGSLYLTERHDLNRHFDALSSVLCPGGLYFLDGCVQFSDPLDFKKNNSYQISQDGISIESTFNISLIDAEQSLYQEIWKVDVDDNGVCRSFEMKEKNRAIFPDNFFEFIKNRSDFEFVGWWADWNFDTPIKTGEHVTRPVVLIRRV